MSAPIERREFLAGALALGATSVLRRPLGTLFGPTARTSQLTDSAKNIHRSLVLCTLYGGNDGLNTVIPYADPNYYATRSGIAIAANDVLDLGDGVGLNPAMPELKGLWDAGHVAIVRGVGYPNASLSHFQAMSIWQSASTSGDVPTGWLGRWLDSTGADPLRACSVGPTVLPAMSGARSQAAAVQDSTYGNSQLPNASSKMLAIYRELNQARPGGDTLVNEIAKSGRDMLSTSHLFAKALDKQPAPTLPKGVEDGDVGTQLDVVSSLIRAGLPTRAYAVTQNGYDTHSGEPATQTQLLGQLDTAISTFFTSIAGHANAAGTTMIVYSEFGRRVVSNGSNGTDHGTANNVFVIGPSVKGGFYGEQPSLKSLDENGNLIFNVDFRSVYATAFEHVLGVDAKSFLGKRYPLLGFI